MTKEVQMTFRVEPELRADFTDAAELDHRPASQVLREFMRAYVHQMRERARTSANDSVSVSVSVAERRRRERAVDFARASVGLEGFKPSKEEEAHARRFINGEIELAEFVQVKATAIVEPVHSR